MMPQRPTPVLPSLLDAECEPLRRGAASHTHTYTHTNTHTHTHTHRHTHTHTHTHVRVRTGKDIHAHPRIDTFIPTHFSLSLFMSPCVCERRHVPNMHKPHLLPPKNCLLGGLGGYPQRHTCKQTAFLPHPPDCYPHLTPSSPLPQVEIPRQRVSQGH
jgi:hypothetical protein